MTLRMGELFAGMGGLGLGVEAAFGDVERVWVSDIDPGSRKVLAHRFPDVPNLGDITTVDWSQVEPVDVLTGGFPCQDVSHAGRRAGIRPGTRSGLWTHFAYAIDQLRPALVVIENVRGLLSATAHSDVEPCPWCVGDNPDGALRALGAVLGGLADLGFDAEWVGLPASRVGAPHGRFRVFVVATDAQGGGWPNLAGCDDPRRAVVGASVGAGDRDYGWDPAAGVQLVGRGAGPLLPSPRTSDTNGAGVHGDGGLDLRTAVSLLPTPTTTQRGTDANREDREGAGPNLHNAVTLLPTPRAGDGEKGGPNQRGSSGDLMLPSAVTHLLPTPAVNDEQRRILGRSEVEPQSGCWMWTGWTNQAATPYGRFSVGNVKLYAHRASYEAFVGPIPEGHEVDHLCQTSLCVNPEHLEAVSPEENRDRVTQRRTHCKRGHEFTEENTYWVRPGARACRECRAWQDRVDKARRKGVEPPLLPTPVTNDMGEGKTIEAWDEWTAKMKAAHGNGNGHGASLAIEAQRLLPTPTTEPDTGNGHARNLGREVTPSLWGQYADAIHRWETLTRPAPPPTETGLKGNPRLSPRFSEWMMGLPDGWITDVPGVTRNEALKLAGNGVCPPQCEAALRYLLTLMEVAA